MNDGEIIRARLFHTPTNPFRTEHALQSYEDGALLIRDGRIAACDDYRTVRRSSPNATCTEWPGSVVLPGLVDAHVHFPQVRIVGHLGRSLLDWLQHVALPEEARLADTRYAAAVAGEFVRSLARSGTTTALVFGAHFPAATASLFEAASAAGLRVTAGLCLSDRLLRDDLLQSAADAYRDSTMLIDRYHRRGRLRYAVTPRFALSTSEAMLDVCQSLADEHRDVRIQTHINEHPDEIADVARAFPWARDYLAVYERYGLVGPRTVMAHNVSPQRSEIERLATSGTSIAHCPCSNAALGSGIFSLRPHITAGVRCALGTDVGGGIGFGVLKEALQAYLMQRVATEPMTLDAAQLLYLATRAGAEALELEREVGDFTVGKAADLVVIRPPDGSAFAAALAHADRPDQALAAVFTGAHEDSICEVRVDGCVVHRLRGPSPVAPD